MYYLNKIPLRIRLTGIFIFSCGIIILFPFLFIIFSFPKNINPFIIKIVDLGLFTTCVGECIGWQDLIVMSQARRVFHASFLLAESLFSIILGLVLTLGVARSRK